MRRWRSKRSQWPHDVPGDATRRLNLGSELLIERSDFAEVPPKGWRRLSPGGEVRLRRGWVVRCDEVIKDADGVVTELRATADLATLGGAGRLKGPRDDPLAQRRRRRACYGATDRAAV